MPLVPFPEKKAFKRNPNPMFHPFTHKRTPSVSGIFKDLVGMLEKLYGATSQRNLLR